MAHRFYSSANTSGPITDESLFWGRRQFIQSAAVLGLASSGGAQAGWFSDPESPQRLLRPLSYKASADRAAARMTDEYGVTHYNNFYEFGLDKEAPAKSAQELRTSPWSVIVEGELDKPQTFGLEDLLRALPLEERVYRLRCVEAWSMVVPWIGFPLASLLKKVAPNSRAKFVAFETLHDPKQMPGQRPGVLGYSSLDWPYREGLRIDEAMHPLTLIAVGVYGKELPPQNGAPLRLVVPWKYGFKSIKSIVRIRLAEKQPPTSWNLSAPSEYGFYANVNPAVDHPRWSQGKERRIYSSSLTGVERIVTRPFNGYGEQVASLYSGMDLKRYF